jgi:hypothetical protein
MLSKKLMECITKKLMKSSLVSCTFVFIFLSFSTFNPFTMLSLSNFLFIYSPSIVAFVNTPSSSPFSVLLCSNNQIHNAAITPLELLMQQQHELARKYYIETALKVRILAQIPFPYLLLPNSAPSLSSFRCAILSLQSITTYDLACINTFTCITKLSKYKVST